MPLQPYSLKDTPALIEHLLPVQKLSAESFKEQDARQSKTLTGLGSYWKGRKPLILNKACILGSLLPVTDNLLKDLETFELLMAMDNRSMAVRHGRIKPIDIALRVKGLRTFDLFVTDDEASLPGLTPFDVKDYPYTSTNSRGDELKKIPKLVWRKDISEEKKLKIEAHALPYETYKENVSNAKRPEEIYEVVHNHIWTEINHHLGTSARNFPELVEQLGVARFGHRPKVADVFCGSGQIPFEAARLGCDVYASDLNPISCMLTWGAFNIVGASPEKRKEIEKAQTELIENVQAEIDDLDIESDGHGWQAKAYLYCNEVVCPETGWKVPLLSDFVISKDYKVYAKIEPIETEKRYHIKICIAQSEEEFDQALTGTVVGSHFTHSPDGKTIFRTSINSLRNDSNNNILRQWGKEDFFPKPNDVFQERLYCILWMKPKSQGSSRFDYEFRSVTEDDLEREQRVIDYVAANLEEWQEKGYVPDMVIEKGDETERLYRERGWTHWHHLFTPRQLLVNSLINKYCGSLLKFGFTQVLNNNSRLSRWNGRSGIGQTASVFDNQALNTLYDFG
ncbi:MAG: DUF1156 domain-containing protein, partial [Candidatus Riflebacteria bacterium]